MKTIERVKREKRRLEKQIDKFFASRGMSPGLPQALLSLKANEELERVLIEYYVYRDGVCPVESCVRYKELSGRLPFVILKFSKEENE